MTKPIAVKDVTELLMSDFFKAYWKECGSKEEKFMVDSYVEEAVKTFQYCLKDKQHYIDGARWDVLTEKGVWSNVKVRYRVADDYQKHFHDQDFVFIVYVNAIANKQIHPYVQKAVKALVAKLEDRFPVVAEL